jgi:hypothetical protein
MVDEHVKPDIPNRNELIALVSKHYGFLRENQLRNINVCTTDGLYRIINSGYIYNAPSRLMKPIDRDTMRGLLDTLINRITDNKVKFFLPIPQG